MSKKMSGLLGISKNVNRGHALRIAVGITMLVLLMAGGAGAASAAPIKYNSASIQLINISDEIGDVSNGNGSVNHPDIDIVRVTISKDSDVYTSQIIVYGNIDTTNAQYSITMNDGVKDNYLIMVSYNVNGSDSGIFENTSTLFENTSSWLYNKTRDVEVSANGNTLNIVADFSGIDLTGYTFREAGAYMFASDYMTLLEWDMIDLTATSTPTPTLSVSATPTSVTAGTATNVVFTVTSSGSAVSGATVTLSGVATGSGTTDAIGHATISVTATGAGSITATSSNTGYTSGSTTVSASASSATNSSITGVIITPTTPSAGDEINITVAINNPGASFNGTVEGNVWSPGGTGKYLGWKNMVIPTGTSTATIIGAAGGAKSSYITHEQGTYYYDVFLENVDKGEYYQTATDSRLSVPFTVGPAASVYMSNIVLSASPTNGSVMTLKVTISNPTSSAFTGTMNANIWDSVRGYVLTPQSISIAAGSSTTLNFSYTPVNHGLHSYDFFMVSDSSGQNTKAPWGFACLDYLAGVGFTVG